MISMFTSIRADVCDYNEIMYSVYAKKERAEILWFVKIHLAVMYSSKNNSNSNNTQSHSHLHMDTTFARKQTNSTKCTLDKNMCECMSCMDMYGF